MAEHVIHVAQSPSVLVVISSQGAAHPNKSTFSSYLPSLSHTCVHLLAGKNASVRRLTFTRLYKVQLREADCDFTRIR